MPQKRKTPEGAKRRECPECDKVFRPMTDAMWRAVWRMHLLSVRHKRAIGKAP